MKQEKASIEPDTTMFLLLGCGLGSLLSAIAYLFLGIFIVAGEDEIWSVGALLAGLACIGICVVLGLVTMLYWKYIASKTGALYPRLAGFKFLLAFFAAFFGVILSIGITWPLI